MLTGGQVITILHDIEEQETTFDQQTVSAGINIINWGVHLGHSRGRGDGNYRIHHPSSFVASGINTFRAQQISMTNPRLSANQNRTEGGATLALLYDVEHEHSSS